MEIEKALFPVSKSLRVLQEYAQCNSSRRFAQPRWQDQLSNEHPRKAALAHLHRSASLLDGVKPACFNNIPIASGAPLSVSAGILSGMPPCARWLKSCSARAAAADE